MKDRIKLIRHTLGLTQQKFADRLGIKGNAISQYESGRNAPIDAVVSLICREFNVSEAWLRTGEGEMFVPKEEDALDELAKQYNLSDVDCVLVEKFLKLKPTERQAVIAYMKDVVSALNTKTTPG
ncbi:MAG: helix-turn-helix domain-containing protein [Oscillospiraceae bacterium]|nr:helix-turn-helix domain-containing protein [Oscillospiraceae bacterium]